MLDESVGERELLAALLAVEHLLMELLHVHPVHAVALERQVTPRYRYVRICTSRYWTSSFGKICTHNVQI